jgi:hypothetical protein
MKSDPPQCLVLLFGGCCVRCVCVCRMTWLQADGLHESACSAPALPHSVSMLWRACVLGQGGRGFLRTLC